LAIECERFAASKDFTVVAEFSDDGVSGAAFEERPGLQDLLRASTSKAFEAVIVYAQSRIGRDPYEVGMVVKRLERAKLILWAAKSGKQITVKSQQDGLLTFIEGHGDKQYRLDAVDAGARTNRNRFEAGYVTGGVVFGYTNVCLGGNASRSPRTCACKAPSRRVIDETQAATIRRVFELAAQGLGHKRIAGKLNAEGVPAPRGKWAATGIRETLHNALYRGVVISGRVRKDWDNLTASGRPTRIRVPQSEWKERANESLRIVEPALWDAAHKVLASNKAAFLRQRNGRLLGRPEGPVTGQYLLSGLLRCGECGETLIANSHGAKYSRSYTCRGHLQRGASFCSNGTQLPMHEIHCGVVNSLQTTLTPEAFEQHLRESAQDDEARQSRRA
jgi:site-specific DNA recombinase